MSKINRLFEIVENKEYEKYEYIKDHDLIGALVHKYQIYTKNNAFIRITFDSTVSGFFGKKTNFCRVSFFVPESTTAIDTYKFTDNESEYFEIVSLCRELRDSSFDNYF